MKESGDKSEGVSNNKAKGYGGSGEVGDQGYVH